MKKKMKKNKEKYYLVSIKGTQSGAYTTIVDFITEKELKEVIRTKAYVKEDIAMFVEEIYKKKMKYVNLKGE